GGSVTLIPSQNLLPRGTGPLRRTGEAFSDAGAGAFARSSASLASRSARRRAVFSAVARAAASLGSAASALCARSSSFFLKRASARAFATSASLTIALLPRTHYLARHQYILGRERGKTSGSDGLKVACRTLARPTIGDHLEAELLRTAASRRA